MLRRTGLVYAVLCVSVMLWATSSAHAQCSHGSDCQIILSGTALPGSPAACNPWGLWVWSQPSNNNYGNDGNGAIYFYHIHKSDAHVHASNVNLTGDSVSEDVSGAFSDGTAVSCSVTAHLTSPGKGILDSMSCTVGADACSATDIPITVDISNVK